MKKKNLKLSDLKVQSFITSLKNDQLETLQGGDQTGNGNCVLVVTAAAGCHGTGVACTNAHTCATIISGNCYTFNGCANTGGDICQTFACV